jgi:hypothetical protein
MICMTKAERIAEAVADWREKRALLIEEKNRLEAYRRESVPGSDEYSRLGAKIWGVNNQLGEIKAERKKQCRLIKRELRTSIQLHCFELHSMRMTDDGGVNWRLAYIPVKAAAERNWMLARRMRKR